MHGRSSGQVESALVLRTWSLVDLHKCEQHQATERRYSVDNNDERMHFPQATNVVQSHTSALEDIQRAKEAELEA